MCGRCSQGRVALFMPGAPRKRQPAKPNKQAPPGRAQSFLLEHGGLVCLYLEPHEALLLVELSRVFYTTLTSAQDFWRRLLLATLSIRLPLVFPPHRGPEGDDDVCQVLPGVECPGEGCWLAYFRVAARKCRWLQRVQGNSARVAALCHTSDDNHQDAAAVFSRNSVFFLVLRSVPPCLPMPALSFEALEELLFRRDPSARSSSRVLRDCVVLDATEGGSHPTVAAWYRLEPVSSSSSSSSTTAASGEDGVVLAGDVAAFSACLPPRHAGWECRTMSDPCFEMPFEVYTLWGRSP